MIRIASGTSPARARAEAFVLLAPGYRRWQVRASKRSACKTLRNVRCRTCGCATHWEPLESKPDAKMGVNARNMPPSEIEGVRVRHFDGADTWTYLD